MKVKLSFGHKAVISSLSKLNIESKNFFFRGRRMEVSRISTPKEVQSSTQFILLVASSQEHGISSLSFFGGKESGVYHFWGMQ